RVSKLSPTAGTSVRASRVSSGRFPYTSARAEVTTSYALSMWIALVIIGLVLLAWLLLRSLSRRVPEQKYDPVPDLSVPQSEQWREIVHPVERNGKPVMLQTTRANQKPTIEPYIEDILVPQGTVDLRAL